MHSTLSIDSEVLYKEIERESIVITCGVLFEREKDVVISLLQTIAL